MKCQETLTVPETEGKKKFYISGPITGFPDYRSQFQSLCESVSALGHEPINPAVVEIENGSWLDYMRKDIVLLLSCDGIYMHQHWRRSRGATIEHDLAASLGMTVIYQTPRN